jgi:DNA-binding PadR family transcriptional regulator
LVRQPARSPSISGHGFRLRQGGLVAGKKVTGESRMIDLVDCPCTGKNLARLVHPAILAVLVRESLHGYLILERLAAEAMFREQPPDPAGVYRILKTMEQEGLVTCSWDLQSSGPARRQYTITERGKACLVKWLETITRYQNSIATLVATIHNALQPS